MKAEIIFPYITGIILFISTAIVYNAYEKTGSKPLIVLALGLFFVGLESVLDGYEASLLQTYANGSWNNLAGSLHLSKVLAIDTIRGIFIVAWAAAEIAFVALLAGAEKKSITVGVPTVIFIVGTVETAGLNYSSIQPLEHRIFVSSAIRVLAILVPAALFSGIYILAKLYRDLRSKSLLAYGLAFLIHGLTLPTYSIAKESGPILLGLWYALGGIVPAVLAAAATLLLVKEMEVAEE